MKLEFKPADFCVSSYVDKCDHGGLRDYDCNAQFNAARANKRLAEMIASAPVVYRYSDQGSGAADWSETNDTEHGMFKFTKSARLVDIEEIGK